MNKKQMGDRCLSSKTLSRGKLERYRFVFNSRGVATIIPDEESCVYGVLYEISEKCLERLKKFEGCPRFYKIAKVKVIDENNNQIEAWVFIATDFAEGQPRKEHLNKILQGAKENSLPFEYIQNLKKRYRPVRY